MPLQTAISWLTLTVGITWRTRMRRALALLVLAAVLTGCSRQWTSRTDDASAGNDAAGESAAVQYHFDDTAMDWYTIYDNTLADGWQSWSWGTTSAETDTAQTDAAENSLQRAMAVTYDDVWGAFYLHNDQPIPGAKYDALRFWVHGGRQGGQKLKVVLVDESNSFLPDVAYVDVPADVWTPVEIPLARLGAPWQITGIAWQDATGIEQPTFYLDEIALVDLNLPPTPTPPPVAGPVLSVDVAADRRPIQPEIYGINFGDEALLTQLNIPVRRWGGNATTRYNWQNDVSNRAADWFFENIPNENPTPQQLPDGSAADQFILENRLMGIQSMLTVPLIGWTPKSREIACAFSVTTYGAQANLDPWRPDCGDGMTPDGAPLTGNDPTDTSSAIDPTFVRAWLTHLLQQFGSGAQGGARYISLDNEPMLWHHTHRDVHPAPVGYDELLARTIDYAAAVKTTDPTAFTTGPALWGWSAYFYSALDQAEGGNWWKKAPDRQAHGGLPLVAWYLQQLAAYETRTGMRLLDYLDLHFYPQTPGVALAGVGDQETQARRLRSTRALWDPDYTDESWIAEPIQLIPRMRAWVDEYYPGTKLALTEYNWGALDHLNGALAQADILGIFGREGLDMAMLWAPLDAQQPFAYAFRLYRNYDGRGSTFGDMSVRAVSSDQELLSIYAAQRTQDGALTLMVINKSKDTLISALTMEHFAAADRAQLYRYDISDLHTIRQLPDRPVSSVGFNTAFPGHSITLIVIPPM